MIVEPAVPWLCLVFIAKPLSPPHNPTPYGLTSYPASLVSTHVGLHTHPLGDLHRGGRSDILMGPHFPDKDIS